MKVKKLTFKCLVFGKKYPVKIVQKAKKRQKKRKLPWMEVCAHIVFWLRVDFSIKSPRFSVKACGQLY